MLRRAALLLLLLGGELACGGANGGGDAGPSAADAGAADAGFGDPPEGDPRVEVGTGASSFEPLEVGAMVEVLQGFQAGGRYDGHHVYTSVRMIGLARDALASIVVTISSTTGAEQARTERIPERAPIRDVGMGVLELPGLTPRFMDCCVVAGEEIVMRAVVETIGGEVYEDSRQVQASSCPARGPSLCP